MTGTLRLGVIGTDTSHLPTFAERINTLRDAGKTRCRITQSWTDGRHVMPMEHVTTWNEKACALGVEPADDLDAMLETVDGVLVLSVDGNRHLEHARPALTRGLPTYIDKPLACSLTDARAIQHLVDEHGARCYSASSLRFVTEIDKLDRDALGPIVSVDAVGPGELNDTMEGLFFYGVHAVELVDQILGPGVKRVSAITLPDRDLVRLEYHDGRFASLRLDRKASYTFGAIVHGEKDLTSFTVDFEPVYARLVTRMCNFFEGGDLPVALANLVENVAVMQAGNLSMRRDGAWVELTEIE